MARVWQSSGQSSATRGRITERLTIGSKDSRGRSRWAESPVCRYLRKFCAEEARLTQRWILRLQEVVCAAGPVSHTVDAQLFVQRHAAQELELQKSLASAMASQHSKPSLEHAAADQGTAAHLPQPRKEPWPHHTGQPLA